MHTRRYGWLGRAASGAGLTAALLAPGWGQVRLDPQPAGSTILPTGQRITPAGTQVALHSLPLAAELSADGRHLLVLQAGYETPSLSVVDLPAHRVTQRVDLHDAWLGLTRNLAGDRIFVSGGARGSVWELSFRGGSLALEREFRIPLRGDRPVLIGDVRLDPDDRLLYALDVLGNRIAVLNTQSGLPLGDFRTGQAPYRARLTPDGRHLIVSHWGEASLGLYRLSDRRLVERLPVGQHPTDLLVVPGAVEAPHGAVADGDGRRFPARLFAACAHSDNVWTFGVTEQNRFDLLDVLPVAPRPDAPLGSLPSALGLSADGSVLYIASAGNNTVLSADIREALPEPASVLPTGWFPTAVVGLPDGGLAYLSGKRHPEAGGFAGLLPALSAEQIDFLSTAAVGNLTGPRRQPAPPQTIQHVLLVLSDARGEAWHAGRRAGTTLPGYRPAARGELGQLAWLTAGMETDFFVKLGPAATAGRLSARDLAASGSATRPVAGTLWSNAADAGLRAETFGIGGGAPLDALLRKAASQADLARLTVVRIPGPPADQDKALGQLLEALAARPDYAATAAFVVPVSGSEGAAVVGGAVKANAVHRGFVSAPSVFRTVTWLLGLRPLTQFDEAAPVLRGLFEAPEQVRR